MSDERKTALIVGASRGLGLGLVREYLKRGWHVVATVRGDSPGLAEAAASADGRLQIERLDVTKLEQMPVLVERLSAHAFGLLFVNAGVSNDPHQPFGEVITEEFDWLMHTNVLGPLRVIEAFEGLVLPHGTIAAMSSGLASIENAASGGYELYRASKAALNMLLRSFGARPAQQARSVVLMAPGWVRTDMGGANAPLSVEESVKGVADTLERFAGKPGVRFVSYRGETLPW